nr:MAG TPA: tail tape measure protein [Caudoviricetes sp.]
MPDVSIAIKATDRFSNAMKTMKDSADKFDKSIVGMQSRLNSLNRNKATLKVDTDRARTELRSAEKQFAATGDAISKLALQEKQLTFENARRNLSLVSKEAANVEKQMLKAGNALSKAENTAGNKSFSVDLIKALAIGGIGDSAKQVLYQGANILVGSMLGDEAGNIFSNALSTATTGASAGFMLGGPVGAAIGAAAGGLVGMASGSVQNWSKKDDAFKGYVQNAVEGQLEAQNKSLTDGSALAASRETDQISFATLFKGEDKAKQYLADLVQMANTTPFLYDDLTAMSKTLATYRYDENSILPVLQTIGDTGAALGHSTSDMNAVATAIGRMKSSNKTTLEYLNILNDRGIGAVGMLANAYGVDQGEVYSMISKGQIAGQDAARIILDALTDSFAGSMERQSKTFSGITSTIEGLRQELDNAMGEGYNETRMAGLQAEREWLEGDSGQEMQEAYQAIGAWKASLENAKEQYIRDAVNEAMGSDAYKTAEAEGDAAEMGRIIMKAKIDGMNQYNANEGKDEVLAQELSLIDSVREDTSLNDSYWDAGYTLGQSFSKGRAAGMMGSGNGETSASASPSRMLQGVTLPSGSSYAVGIDYVPYDNFPALLHQGERVQTAEEARSGGSGTSIQIVMNGTVIREDADVERVASALLERMELAGMRG